MANTVSNHCLYQLLIKKIDCSADTFVIILMEDGFVFDKDAHATYADVSADELATGNGYTQNTKTLANVTVEEDDTNNRGRAYWDDAQWTASGGSIGPSPCAIIIDSTTTDDTVIGCIDFGGNKTATDGGVFAVQNIDFGVSGA